MFFLLRSRAGLRTSERENSFRFAPFTLLSSVADEKPSTGLITTNFYLKLKLAGGWGTSFPPVLKANPPPVFKVPGTLYERSEKGCNTVECWPVLSCASALGDTLSNFAHRYYVKITKDDSEMSKKDSGVSQEKIRNKSERLRI